MVAEGTSSSTTTAEVPAASRRLVSLDAFRGFTMFWIVGGGSLMLGLDALGHNPVLDFLV